MDDEEKAATRRSKLMAKVNEARAYMVAAGARVDRAREGLAKVAHAARSEMGVARAEHLKAIEAYSTARRRLLEHVPPVPESVAVRLEKGVRFEEEEDLDEVLGDPS